MKLTTSLALVAVLLVTPGHFALANDTSEPEAANVPVLVKSLTDYPGRTRSVTETQKAEIRAVLEKLDGHTKFICTGARLAGQSEGMNLAVRMRAKLVCEYAKSLRPDLSYWYQTKLTEKRSFNGRVIVVSK